VVSLLKLVLSVFLSGKLTPKVLEYFFLFYVTLFFHHHIYFDSESEHAYLITIHSVSSYDLKLFIVDFLSGKERSVMSIGISIFEGETDGSWTAGK
jgi:hypothetical protein